MHFFGGYRLGCAGCASGSLSDLSRVIGRDHFLSVCPGSCRNRMLYSIVCCYRFYHRLCIAVAEDHSASVMFVFSIHLVLPFVHFSLSAIKCVRHGVCHGGLTNYRILSTQRWVKIRVKYRSKFCPSAHFCLNLRREVLIVANVGLICCCCGWY
jgi:hypothetical protein